MKRRILAVGLAVVLAVLGTAGVLAYVNQANARAVQGVKAVSVLVAQGHIPSGTSAGSAEQAGLLRSEKLPAQSVPSNAVRSITPDLKTLVTSADVQPGQMLLRPMLVAAAQSAGGLAVPHGMVAVTIVLCVPAAVAGNVHPGSQVMVFDTTDPSSGSSGNNQLSEGAACSGQHQQSNPHARTKVVLPQVEVLSIGPAAASNGQASSQTATASSTQGNSSTTLSPNGVMLLTVAVSQANAQRLILLTETGLPYLALLK